MVVVAVMVVAEWLRAPSPAWAAAAGLAAALAALLSLLTRTRRGVVLGLALVALAATVFVTAHRLRLIATDWPAQREARITAYGERVGGELRSALRAASDLAEAGAKVAGEPQDRAFQRLASAIPRRGVELGVAILDPDGAPWAWAGRHRLAPTVLGDSIDASASGYYVTLETRRHSAGRIVVANVLIWADSAVPDRARSVAARFRRQTEIGLHVYPPGAAPEHNPDIFDYFEPTTAGPRLLFSVQPVPPTQDEARLRVQTRGGRGVLLLLGLVTVLALAQGATAVSRTLLLLGPVWVLARAPADALLGLGRLFAPGTITGPALGALPVSPAALGLSGALITLLALLPIRHPRQQRRTLIPLGVLAAALALLLVWLLGGALVPPEGTSGFGRWMVWQGALVLVGAAPAVVGRVLFGASPRQWPAAAAVLLSGAIAFGAVWTWSPGQEWSAMLPLLFLLPLLLAMAARGRLVALAAIGATLGFLVSLLVWRAAVTARMDLAGRDIGALGAQADTLARPLLVQFADEVLHSPAPETGAQLYTLWRASALHAKGYPAQLALRDHEGRPVADLTLDSLAVPPELIGAMARGLSDTVGAMDVRAVPATPGTHHVLALRLATDRVLSVAVGPRSALVAPDRLGRLLAPARQQATPYRLILGAPQATAGTEPLAWRRVGWSLQTGRAVALPGGPRDVQATVTMLGTAPIVVRGVLLAIFDVLLLLAIGGASAALRGGAALAPGWARIGRSFRLRVALALALFFVLPTISFSIWAFSHFADEAERGRDLLIRQTLRDAAQGAGSMLRTPGAPVDATLRGLSERVDADLALYRGGSLVATSAPVLRDLGVVTPLMDPRAFRAMALGGELELAQAGLIPALAERVGYRVIEFGPPSGVGVLATPQAGGDVDPGRPQRELALILLLGMSLGIAAALGGAGVVARALTRPVADLRRSALALGQGKPTPLPESQPPVEFEPVFGAFQRMAADVRASQAALEQARRRTATVLETITTGVIAIDADARVMIANSRARALIGSRLDEGAPLDDALPADWAGVRADIERVMREHEPAGQATEHTVGDQRITIETAPLGPELRGLVIALNDVTELSRAERVLAWGEMARQVAHEIKNPLTPMRLGIQHLRRVHADSGANFGQTLAETSERILSEIDRLDTIARAFSRFAAPAGAAPTLERVDLAALASDVVQLYRLTAEGVQVSLTARGEAWGGARRDEVREVLVNLLENSREAGAREIVVTVGQASLEVRDDGNGMSPDILARAFEPRFSTNTSGSGLGLAIVRRLVEGWGGTVSAESQEGQGTIVRVTTGAAPPA
jgi:signal transduction histidine kinase